MSKTEYRNWRVDSDLDGLCWLTLDRAGESANSLSRDVLTELEAIVTHLERNHPRGLVLQSGKPGSFIVGADVREFDDANSISEAEGFIRDVHALFDRVEALPFPKVVTIDGYCLGGGLELALCFDYRIAANNDRTRLGFPEVKLGIYPGFGGSARAVRQCGPLQAMPLMLSARNLRPGAARGMGLEKPNPGSDGTMTSKASAGPLRLAARLTPMRFSRSVRGPRQIGWLVFSQS